MVDSDDVDFGKFGILICVEILLFGWRGRFVFFILKEKFEFFLDMKFIFGEIVFMFCVSVSIVKRRICEYDIFVR